MTNDEGQMRNPWGKLKVSRRWVVVLAAIAIISFLCFAAFRKPAVTLEIVKIETLPLLWLPYVENGVKNGAYDRTVVTLELRNNSKKAIQVAELSSGMVPTFLCAYWANGYWHQDWGSSAYRMHHDKDLVSRPDQVEGLYDFKLETYQGSGRSWRGTTIPWGVKWWGRIAVGPGETIRFSAALLEKDQPCTVIVPFRTPQPMLRHLSFLPDAVTQHLPWLFEQHVIKSEILLNGTETRPALPSGQFDRDIWDGYKPKKKK
jgi:hypothetical protein